MSEQEILKKIEECEKRINHLEHRVITLEKFNKTMRWVLGRLIPAIFTIVGTIVYIVVYFI